MDDYHAMGCPLPTDPVSNTSGLSLIWSGGWAFPPEIALRSIIQFQATGHGAGRSCVLLQGEYIPALRAWRDKYKSVQSDRDEHQRRQSCASQRRSAMRKDPDKKGIIVGTLMYPGCKLVCTPKSTGIAAPTPWLYQQPGCSF